MRHKIFFLNYLSKKIISICRHGDIDVHDNVATRSSIFCDDLTHFTSFYTHIPECINREMNSKYVQRRCRGEVSVGSWLEVEARP